MDVLVAKQVAAVPVPQLRHETVEVIQPVLVEPIKVRVAGQMMDFPVRAMEEIVAVVQVVRLVPQERVHQRIGELLVELLVPQNCGRDR